MIEFWVKSFFFIYFLISEYFRIFKADNTENTNS